MRPSRSVVFVCCLAAGCSPKEPAESPPASTSAAAPAAPLASVTTAEAAPPEPSASAADPEPAPAEPVIERPALPELCGRVCDKMEASCNASVVMSCRANCRRYETAPEPCYDVGRDAFTCWERAENLPCANIVPDTCGATFRRFTQCQNDPDGFVQETKSSGGGATGFQPFEPEGGGFVAVAPVPMTKSQQGAEATWSAEADGVRYFVRKLPLPTEKYTSKSRVRLAMQWLSPCTQKMKLHGQVDTDDGLSVHYDGVCESGSERHGIIHLTKDALFIIGVEGPAGERGQFDAFVYGFKPKPTHP